jgi:hypothetical protein
MGTWIEVYPVDSPSIGTFLCFRIEAETQYQSVLFGFELGYLREWLNKRQECVFK